MKMMLVFCVLASCGLAEGHHVSETHTASIFNPEDGDKRSVTTHKTNIDKDTIFRKFSHVASVNFRNKEMPQAVV
jgi:hypothetical protein